MAKFKHFDVQQVSDVAVLYLLDAKLFDTLVVTELQDEMLDFIDTNTPSKVLLNFANVTHCSTAVINTLLRAKKRLMNENGRLKLCGMRDVVREAYRMLNLDGTVFEIYNSPSDGLNAF